MELPVILANIERLLRAKKMSADKASRLAGKPDAIRNIKRKIKGEIQGNGISIETLESLARVLDTTAEALRRSPDRISITPVRGLRESIIAKIAWLDSQREQAERELAALDDAELAQKRLVKRSRSAK